MKSWTRKLCVCILSAWGAHAAPAADAAITALSTCQAIGDKISSSSSLIYAAALSFSTDNYHWFQSSSQIPTCVLEVGSSQDVAAALQIIAKNKTPFAVKSGGHASNPGFSSTTGVMIVFDHMKQVTLSTDKSYVELGMGLVWTDVYESLQGSGRNVVGGRVTGPGVGGFSLGGGFSWKTNQFGLTSDTIKAYNLVLPNGTITRVETSSHSDLSFALKGGLNRFGIVTSAEYYTHSQPPIVYGGYAVYGPSSVTAVLNATQAFNTQNTDPKSQIITTLQASVTGQVALVLFFHDGPTRPASFAPFDSITPLANAVKSQSFSSFVSSVPSELQQNARGRFNTISTTKLTHNYLTAVLNETTYYGNQILLHGGSVVNYDIEPFLDYGKHAADGAYPHSQSPLPLNLYFAWVGAVNDDYWVNAIRESAERLEQIAVAEGIMPSSFTRYPNYALAGTSAPDLYGSANAARLAAIRQRVDPDGVMELTGGFTI